MQLRTYTDASPSRHLKEGYSLNIYKIIASECDWDEFDSCIVLAENEQEALDIADKATYNEHECYFSQGQYPLKVEKIDLTEKGIIHSSFNAG